MANNSIIAMSELLTIIKKVARNNATIATCADAQAVYDCMLLDLANELFPLSSGYNADKRNHLAVTAMLFASREVQGNHNATS